ncbi:uncharacterized protein UTRI_03683 [Ustilago trichophora]|uniref:Uncharacterized protein n=1 Tax=Ustilago trichophora TaxID=86804 RepID=A0A5C3E2R1_9BASI|nr:uncharacterized protein UTRI_03683 [Ustilago trichophora]
MISGLRCFDSTRTKGVRGCEHTVTVTLLHSNYKILSRKKEQQSPSPTQLSISLKACMGGMAADKHWQSASKTHRHFLCHGISLQPGTLPICSCNAVVHLRTPQAFDIAPHEREKVGSSGHRPHNNRPRHAHDSIAYARLAVSRLEPTRLHAPTGGMDCR